MWIETSQLYLNNVVSVENPSSKPSISVPSDRTLQLFKNKTQNSSQHYLIYNKIWSIRCKSLIASHLVGCTSSSTNWNSLSSDARSISMVPLFAVFNARYGFKPASQERELLFTIAVVQNFTQDVNFNRSTLPFHTRRSSQNLNLWWLHSLTALGKHVVKC